MKNKYSLKRILQEAWGSNYGLDWGVGEDPDMDLGTWGGDAGGGAIDGYTYPLGLWAGHGYDRSDRIFTSVHSYVNDFSGDFADHLDNPKAAGYALDGNSIKKSGMTFGSKSPGNTFTGPYANYKSPVEKMVRDYGLPSRKLSDILPDPASGVFTKATRPKILGKPYKPYKLAK